MQLKLTLLAVVAAFALASVNNVSADDSAALSNSTFVEENGITYRVFSDGGDPAGELNDDDAADNEDDDDDEVEPVRRSRKHRHRSSRKNKSKGRHFSVGPDAGAKRYPNPMEITWYSANDLKNPACGTGNWDPTPNSHIGAVMKSWKSGPQCGEFVQICNPAAKNRCVRVRVVDACAGCKANAVDLTKSAFRRLSGSGTLREGRIKKLHMYHSSMPKEYNRDLFGPIRIGVHVW